MAIIFLQILNQSLSSLKEELLSKISFFIQALGGIMALYLILIIIRIYLMKKEFEMIKEIKKDIKKIIKITSKKY